MQLSSLNQDKDDNGEIEEQDEEYEDGRASEEEKVSA